MRSATRKTIPSVAALLVFLAALSPHAAGAAPYLVKDINPGPSGSAYSQKHVSYPSPAALGGVVFFQADDGVHGSELWKSDGTAGNTVMVKDIWSGADGIFSSKPDQFTAAGSYLFFAASGREDPVTFNADYELWRTDGTTGNTVSLDVYAGTTSSSPGQLTAVGSTLYFTAYDESVGRELFAVSGGGVSLVRDFHPGQDNGFPQALAAGTLGTVTPKSWLFFNADTGDGDRELWKSDGGTTALVKDIWSGGLNSSYPYGFTSFEGKVYFIAEDGTNGSELWVTDGSESGTLLVSDIVPGIGGSNVSHITPAGTEFFFFVRIGGDTELWKSDGTGPNTVRVATVQPTDIYFAGRNRPVYFDNRVWFAASDVDNGCELWASDGTGAGTAMFVDLNPGVASSCPSDLTVADGILYFAARTETVGSGRELWATNGTDTVLAAETPGWEVDGPEGLTVAGSNIFFLAKGLDTGRELWAMPTGNVVSQPDIPAGQSFGEAGIPYTYVTGGSVALKGSTVEYHFDWGDGTNSGWLAAGTVDSTHTWAGPGTYTVTVEARDTISTPAILSPPATRTVVISVTETVSTPVITGPVSGTTGVSMGYEISGAASNLGHTIEYRIDWADGGGFTPWQPYADPVSLVNTWASAGSYLVTVEVRCQADTPVLSSNTLGVTISDPLPAEQITGYDLTGTWDGEIFTSYDYTVSALSTVDDALEYTVDWGDGTSSAWTPIDTVTDRDTLAHSWSDPGNYELVVTVRCQTDTDKTATGSWWVNIVNPVPEIIDPAPTDPSGPTEVWRGYSASFSSGGAVSTWGSAVEYEFDWGDGTTSGWLPAGPGNTVTASHSWGTTGSPYYVWVTARSVNDPGNVHATSGHLTISIIDPEVVNPPGIPGGQTFGAVGTVYAYTSDLAVSTMGHTLEYQFDWGDGTLSPWSTSRTATYAWSAAGDPWQVRSRARCAGHTEVVSSWSVPLDVVMLGGAGGALFVCKSGCTYASIQGAVDAAADGNTINVGDGLYAEDIDFGGKDLAIVSLGGPSAATIAGSGTGPAVTVSAAPPWATALLEGFTVKGGAASKGGGIFVSGAQAEVRRCIVSGNSATDGGGIYATAAELAVINTVVSGNRASIDGGGIFLAGTAADIVNSTVAGNRADEFGGGLVNYTGAPSVLNSIFWGNSAGIEGDQIDVDSGSIAVAWSDIETSGTPWPGTGNISADPRFVSPLTASYAPTAGGDYHLTAGSPCLDSGAGTGDPLIPADDLDGDGRPQYSAHDMGADEGDEPQATILANGTAHSVTVSRSDTIDVTITLAPGAYLGASADFWVLVRTPFRPPGDWYHFLPPRLWLPGDTVTYRGAAMKLGSYKVLSRKLPPGRYTFYFGIDLAGNGTLDTRDLFYDSVTVTVTP